MDDRFHGNCKPSTDNNYPLQYGNKTSTKYGFPPYPLEDYLNVTAEDAYDGDDIDDEMLAIVEY